MTQPDQKRIIGQIAAAANQLSPDEAAQRYSQIMAQLPPDVAAQLNAVAFSQVPADARRQVAAQLKRANDDPSRPFDGFTYADDDEGAQPVALGRMTKQARDQDPDVLQGVLGGQGGLGGQLGKMALSLLAYMLIQRIMGQQASGRGAQQETADPLGGLLGGLLGGALGGGQAQRGASDPMADILGGLLGGALGGGQAQTSGAAADPIGSILGGLLGGGQMSQDDADRMGRSIGDVLGSMPAQQRQPAPRAQQPAADPMADILGGLLGGALGGGQAQRGGSDPMADILGGLLGGALGGQGVAPQSPPQADSGLTVRGSRRKRKQS